MGEIFAGRYELVDLIGEGGMGSVWRAWDYREGDYRAAKVLRQSDSLSVMRFIRESSWRIDHPHVLTPRGWVGEDDRVLVSLPIVRGGSLATVLSDYGKLSWSWLRVILDQVLDALTAVHAAKVIHRDIKPANILLDATGAGTPHVYLSDFGIAWAEGDPRLTRASEIVGTRAYQSPASLQGAAPTAADDLYALGVVITVALTASYDATRLPAMVATYVQRLQGHGDAFATAERAREALGEIDLIEDAGEPVEVFDHIPALPLGWGPDGPSPKTDTLPDRHGEAEPTFVAPPPLPTERTESTEVTESFVAPDVHDDGPESSSRFAVVAVLALLALGAGLLVVAYLLWP